MSKFELVPKLAVIDDYIARIAARPAVAAASQ
jgi:hypothetical protein